MINTYQTSLAPPPVPPRQGRSQPILIPASLPSPGYSKPLIRFLVGVVVLHLLLSMAAFFYLYNKYQKQSISNIQAEEKAYFSSERKEMSHRALARMAVYQQPKTPVKNTSGYLQWDMKHSVRKDINYFGSSWLTILQPGDYYVFSSVTFSKGDRVKPLASSIVLRKDPGETEEAVMQAYCNLDSALAVPLCTATQGGLITLEKGDKLAVWVQNLSLVDYMGTATSFGMYKV